MCVCVFAMFDVCVCSSVCVHAIKRYVRSYDTSVEYVYDVCICKGVCLCAYVCVRVYVCVCGVDVFRKRWST